MLSNLIFLIIVIVSLLTILIFIILRSRNLHLWIMPYYLSKFKRSDSAKIPIHIMFCFVDHYEPKWRNPSKDQERSRVDRWMVE